MKREDKDTHQMPSKRAEILEARMREILDEATRHHKLREKLGL